MNPFNTPISRRGSHKLQTLLASLMLVGTGSLQADSSIGIDPYAEGYGFDRPIEAAWGGWTRCQTGTLYAEWDLFVDASHGAADDRTAAPNAGTESAASCGVTSAFLGWDTTATNPAFAYSNGNYIYNASNSYQGGPTSFRVDLTGNLTPGLTRVALQIETRSYPIPEASLTLNDVKPTLVGNKFEKEVTINGRAAKVYHQLVVWNLTSAPEALLIKFESPAHTVIQLISVDAGPLESTQSGGTEENATAKFLLNVPSEEINPAWSTSLHDQRPKAFPAAWENSELLYKKTTNKTGTKVSRSLKGGIKALYHDQASGGGSNRIFLDIYRPDAIADIKIAECELKPTQKKPWSHINQNNQLIKLSTSLFALNLTSTEYPENSEKNKIKASAGECDIDLDTTGIQSEIPELQDGDYTRFRRFSE